MTDNNNTPQHRREPTFHQKRDKSKDDDYVAAPQSAPGRARGLPGKSSRSQNRYAGIPAPTVQLRVLTEPVFQPPKPLPEYPDIFGGILNMPVQLATTWRQEPDAGRPTSDQVHQIAAKGVQGSGTALPHLERIQQSFGDAHDLGGIQAHIGGDAAVAAKAIGAQAYATGNNVAFDSAPDLHTAAHEAAHIVQQRAGVQLKGGVGQVGDMCERNADAVADRVVAGESAADLLAPHRVPAATTIARKSNDTDSTTHTGRPGAALEYKWPGTMRGRIKISGSMSISPSQTTAAGGKSGRFSGGFAEFKHSFSRDRATGLAGNWAMKLAKGDVKLFERNGIKVTIDASVFEFSTRSFKVASVKISIAGDATTLLRPPPGYKAKVAMSFEVPVSAGDARRLRALSNSSRKALGHAKDMARQRKKANKVARQIHSLNGIRGNNYGPVQVKEDRAQLKFLKERRRLGKPVNANLGRDIPTLERRLRKHARLETQWKRADNAANAAGKRLHRSQKIVTKAQNALKGPWARRFGKVMGTKMVQRLAATLGRVIPGVGTLLLVLDIAEALSKAWELLNGRARLTLTPSGTAHGKGTGSDSKGGDGDGKGRSKVRKGNRVNKSRTGTKRDSKGSGKGSKHGTPDGTVKNGTKHGSPTAPPGAQPGSGKKNRGGNKHKRYGAAADPTFGNRIAVSDQLIGYRNGRVHLKPAGIEALKWHQYSRGKQTARLVGLSLKPHKKNDPKLVIYTLKIQFQIINEKPVTEKHTFAYSPGATKGNRHHRRQRVRYDKVLRPYLVFPKKHGGRVRLNSKPTLNFGPFEAKVIRLEDSKPLPKRQYRIRVWLKPTLIHAPFMVSHEVGEFKDVTPGRSVIIEFMIKVR